MAIRIEHRFLDRLLPGPQIEEINYVIIGTFNPAAPIKHLLTKQESLAFGAIEESRKYKRFNEVRNFYDRPQNRFWKIMDLIHNESFYKTSPIKTKNIGGYKYYKGMDRDLVFERQNKFCSQKGILITDIVRAIEPATFVNIYDKFPDLGIEQSTCEWNTDGIIKVIEKFNPKRVLINFRINNRAIPKISFQAEIIKKKYENRVFNVDSTSGNAGYTYSALFETWSKHFTR